MIVRCFKCNKLTERFGTGEYQQKDKSFKCDCKKNGKNK